ncbi:MAG: arylsulfatase [Planctomycetia bacterium]|nr:arylsulfatase [Planctomycetia bacterium]
MKRIRGAWCCAIGLVFALGLSFCATASGADSVAKETRPTNIIFILADDLGIGELGCYGQTKIQTPHLDNLAREGMRFTCAYSGASVCAPSRATLMTGLSTGHCPIRANRELQPVGQRPLPEETQTVAQILQSAGYATGCFGKWGMGTMDSSGSPLKKGFDRFFGYNCQRHAHNYFTNFLYDNEARRELDGKTYSADLIVDEMMGWLEENADRPFFLFYATTLPHQKYEIDDLGIYADKKGWTNLQKNYAAMVTRLDTHVGRIVAWLREKGLEKNTLIVFSGDNGGALAPDSGKARFFNQNLHYRGYKRTVYEGGLRNAALAWQPGKIAPGQTCDIPWYFPDFLPTCAEIAGVSVPEQIQTDGVSITPILWENRAVERKPMYWELHEIGFIQAVRFREWKAVRNGAEAPIEIYNLEQDPGEQHDLAKDQPEIVAEAERLLRELRTDDPSWPTK